MKAVKLCVLACVAFFAVCAAGHLYARSAGAYLEGASWPVMRGDLRNTGHGKYMDFEADPQKFNRPLRWRTGNGIFSTPVMDGDENIYVGSADHYFYCFDPQTGKMIWKFDALELIDSAGALSADGKVYVPAGAGIYALGLDGDKIWEFDVTNNRPEGLYTFGTNYWWEGNVVTGPEGSVYAGNNDFFFYKITPGGEMDWAHRTGFLIWSVPAFGPDDSMYFAGFDMKLYALDRNTGKQKWKKNLKNPLVASPALSTDGTIYQGSFDGNLYAIDAKNGKTKWKLRTDSHIYSSAALDNHGRVYVNSTDGFLYAIDGKSGEVLWTFYTGDAVRCSPVLGPDPEGKEEYLVYFGGGQGNVFAIAPDGQRRWSWNTHELTGGLDYPNINASPALGKYGITVANANGDVFYIPYDYYLKDDARGITVDPTEGFEETGARWHYVSAGGVIDKDPVGVSQADETIAVHPRQALVLRLLVPRQGRVARALIEPGSVKMSASPSFKHRLRVVGDDKTVVIVPEEMLEPGRQYSIRLSARYNTREGDAGNVRGMLSIRVKTPDAKSPFMEGGHPGFMITHMALPQPPIVPSLDQIGIAILKIPFAVVATDPAKGTFAAWGVQKYGESAGGEEKGLPDSRSLFYAFGGDVEDEFFMFQAKNCSFEETSFPFPLDILRYSGEMKKDGTVDKGASLYAELDPPPILEAFSMLRYSSETAASGSENWFKSSLSGGGSKGFMEAASTTLPTVIGYLANRIWEPWDMYNHEGVFVTTGTFRMKEMQAAKTRAPEGLRVKSFEYDGLKKEVSAEVAVESNEGRYTAVGIMLVDKETGKPVPINYNLEMARMRLENGDKKTVLSVPGKDLHSGRMEAYLMADMEPLQKLDIEM